MASVFLSYDRDDRARAAAITAALEEAGHSVWWDQQIRGGAQYSKEIEQALNNADAVAVLWSKGSVDSAWVRDEAAAGRDTGRLVPVLIEPCTPPMGFRQYQTIDLTKSKGRARTAGLRQLVSAVEAVAGNAPETMAQPATDRPLPKRKAALPTRAAAAAAALTVVALAAVALWTLSLDRDSAAYFAVEAGDTSAASAAIAADLRAKLGDLETARADSLQLVGSGGDAAPDLLLQVAGGVAGHGATLTLLRAKDRLVIGAREFPASASRDGDLSRQLTAKSATLLACSGEAARRGAEIVPTSTLRQWVDACEGFTELFGIADVALLVPKLTGVVSAAPKFRPALTDLLLAEASDFWIPDQRERYAGRPLRQHLAQARRLDRSRADADFAESALLPLRDYQGRLRLIDRGIGTEIDNPFALMIRSNELMRVGRMTDALTDAERAQRLHPLLPAANQAYVLALAYSGQIAKAMAKLDEAQRTSPTARNLLEARFRLLLRYGNPEQALALLRQFGTSQQHEAFLKARISRQPASEDLAIGLARGSLERFGYGASYAEVLASFGRTDELYHTLMALPVDQQDPTIAATLFRPLMKQFRRESRFMDVADRLGLVDYWRTSGKWPDFCFEPDLPYDCKAEAAKLS